MPTDLANRSEWAYTLTMTIGLFLYRLATQIISPFSGLVLRRRVKQGKEILANLPDRNARSFEPRPAGALIWFHGASVGECSVLLALAKEIRETHPEISCLFTCQTLTAAKRIRETVSTDPEFQSAWVDQYMAPLDTPSCAKRFAAHWKPDIVLVAEGDIWPNLLRAVKRTSSRIVLVNARMTEKSIRGWAKWPKSSLEVFGLFDQLLASDTRTKAGLDEISGQTATLTHNLKSAIPPPSVDHDQLESIRDKIGDRKVLLAASTHEGEEAIILDAFMQMDARPFLIIAPRHPERGEWISNLLDLTNFQYAHRSLGEHILDETDILLADTLGEMGLWYRLCDTVYLGGGHAPGIGGHNPMEALRLGKPVMTGPSVFNFDDMVGDLKQKNAISIVDGAEDIVRLFPIAPPAQSILSVLESQAMAPMTSTLNALATLLNELGHKT